MGNQHGNSLMLVGPSETERISGSHIDENLKIQSNPKGNFGYYMKIERWSMIIDIYYMLDEKIILTCNI